VLLLTTLDPHGTMCSDFLTPILIDRIQNPYQQNTKHIPYILTYKFTTKYCRKVGGTTSPGHKIKKFWVSQNTAPAALPSNEAISYTE